MTIFLHFSAACQAIIPSRNLEPYAFAVQHLGTWRWLLDLVRGRPMRALTILYQRSSETFVSGWLPQKPTSVFRAADLKEVKALLDELA
jgi:hypothetical protein